MIVIDLNSQVQELFKAHQIFDPITFIPYEVFESMGFNPAQELVMVHSELIEKLEKELTRFEGVGVVKFKKRADYSGQNLLVEVLTEQVKQDFSKAIKIDRLLSEKSIIKSQLLTLHNEFENLLKEVESEVSRAKDLYDKIGKKRQKSFQNFNVYSKYAPGVGKGGDFFDFDETEQELLFFMSYSSSYLFTMEVISQFGAFKNAKQFRSQDLEALEQELSSVELGGSEDNIQWDYFVGIIHKKTLKFSFLHSSEMHIFLGDRKLAGVSEIELKGGERILLASRGLFLNQGSLDVTTEVNKAVSAKNLCMDQLDEIFFTYKEQHQGSYLPQDLTMILIEVSKNALRQL